MPLMGTPSLSCWGGSGGVFLSAMIDGTVEIAGLVRDLCLLGRLCSRSRCNPNCLAILLYLSRHQPEEASSLVIDCGLSKSSVYWHLGRLRAMGCVKMEYGKDAYRQRVMQWRLTASGTRLVLACEREYRKMQQGERERAHFAALRGSR